MNENNLLLVFQFLLKEEKINVKQQYLSYMDFKRAFIRRGYLIKDSISIDNILKEVGLS